jgi:hypothetical protein
MGRSLDRLRVSWVSMGLRVADRRTARRLRAFAAAASFAAAAAALAGVAPAQPKTPSRAASPRRGSAGDAGAPSFRSAVSATAQAVVAPAPAGGLDAGVVEAKTLDGGTRVFKFKELDIEGRLKSPQLVYFLRRVRAEFGAEDLGHRSFLPEMSETRKESTF